MAVDIQAPEGKLNTKISKSLKVNGKRVNYRGQRVKNVNCGKQIMRDRGKSCTDDDQQMIKVRSKGIGPAENKKDNGMSKLPYCIMVYPIVFIYYRGMCKSGKEAEILHTCRLLTE